MPVQAKTENTTVNMAGQLNVRPGGSAVDSIVNSRGVLRIEEADRCQAGRPVH